MQTLHFANQLSYPVIGIIYFIISIIIIIIDDPLTFYEELEKEARESFKDEGKGGPMESMIGLHLLLSRGQSPMPSSRPQISNSITSSYLSRHHGIELNTKLEGYSDRYIAYLRRAGIL